MARIQLDGGAGGDDGKRLNAFMMRQIHGKPSRQFQLTGLLPPGTIDYANWSNHAWRRQTLVTSHRLASTAAGNLVPHPLQWGDDTSYDSAIAPPISTGQTLLDGTLASHRRPCHRCTGDRQ